ncbi:hypothetical protein OUZ56_017269 [Daphnia magna]|uniref:Uncharacterized protein n=1 Tax=Daphnia magna TaxID=35525 RepID=A0ABR0ASM3_9CRUS|nr:hypothetical protein OUZ56_017269 [Daphnia magna]
MQTLYKEEISRTLLPKEFIVSGQVVACDIPVPCFPVSFSCPTCDCLTAFSLTAGKRRIVIITERVIKTTFRSTMLLTSVPIPGVMVSTQTLNLAIRVQISVGH